MSIYINNNGTAERRDAGAGSIPTLSGLNDVLIDDSTLSDGDMLVYDDEEEKWKNAEGSSKFMLPDGSNSEDTVKLKRSLYVGPGSANSYIYQVTIEKSSGDNQPITITSSNGFSDIWLTRFNAFKNKDGVVSVVINNVKVPIKITGVTSTVVTAYLEDDDPGAISVTANSVMLYWNTFTKWNSIVSGNGAVAYGGNALATGYGVVSNSYSHSEGNITVASGMYSHAEGYDTLASGQGSHVEGSSTFATNTNAHAEGNNTKASGAASHAEGNNTEAVGNYAHVEGQGNSAGQNYQHVSGKYNNNKSDTLFEVGNGTSSRARSNAFEVTSDGYIRTKGRADKIAFGVDSNGNYGYIPAGADTVIPFKSESVYSSITSFVNTQTTWGQYLDTSYSYNAFGTYFYGKKILLYAQTLSQYDHGDVYNRGAPTIRFEGLSNDAQEIIHDDYAGSLWKATMNLPYGNLHFKSSVDVNLNTGDVAVLMVVFVLD